MAPYLLIDSLMRLLLLILFLAVSAHADLLYWTPAGQESSLEKGKTITTYILPASRTPEEYLALMRQYPSLEPFTQNMKYSAEDRVQIVKTESSSSDSSAVLLVANRAEDHEKVHNRVDDFGRFLPHTYVYPIGAALKLNAAEEKSFYQDLTRVFHLFVFMGGADKDPSLYGEPRTGAKETVRYRDQLEQKLIRYVYYRSQAKIFGVCRGLQQVFTGLGGKLHQDIPTDFKLENRVHADGSFHDIEYLKTQNGLLQDIMEGHLGQNVNSYHHQAARKSTVPGTVFQVAAESHEGIVEALESRDGRVFLVQFHPEKRDMDSSSISKSFFHKLLGWSAGAVIHSCRNLLSK